VCCVGSDQNHTDTAAGVIAITDTAPLGKLVVLVT